MIIRTTPSGQIDGRLAGPVVAFSDIGERLAVAEAREVANAIALQFTYLNADAPPEVACGTLAITTALAHFMNDREVPFVPYGRAFDKVRESARLIGFDETTNTVWERLQLYGFPPAPHGAVVPDMTSALPFAKLSLKLIAADQVDIRLFSYRWALAYLETLATSGVPIQDRPPDPRWIH